MSQQASASSSQFLWLREPLIDGPTGPMGVSPAGATGPAGSSTGATGATGNNGQPGPVGFQGSFGPRVQGPTGPIGVSGQVGSTGPQGSPGATGPNNTQGYSIEFGISKLIADNVPQTVNPGLLATGIYCIALTSVAFPTKNVYQEFYSKNGVMSFLQGNNISISPPDPKQTSVKYIDDTTSVSLTLNESRTVITILSRTASVSGDTFGIRVYKISDYPY